MKLWILLLFLGFGFAANAQQVISNGVAYEVKGKAIFKDGVDVTETLSVEQQKEIKSTLDKKLKEASKAEKAIKKAEKEAKKAEKAQKRAEKDLKLKQKAQDRFERASKNLSKNQEKYEKLKRKGKLSPNDEIKWLKKLEDYKEDLDKAKKKLERS
jgi:membrane carboxypeptidase/penicillin-binding protein